MDRKELMDKATAFIKNEPLVQKYMSRRHWVSGSSTIVYPITCWIESGTIDVQLDCERNVFSKCIERIIKASNGLIEYGGYVKSDGSCPNELYFKVNYDYKQN